MNLFTSTLLFCTLTLVFSQIYNYSGTWTYSYTYQEYPGMCCCPQSNTLTFVQNDSTVWFSFAWGCGCAGTNYTALNNYTSDVSRGYFNVPEQDFVGFVTPNNNSLVLVDASACNYIFIQNFTTFTNTTTYNIAGNYELQSTYETYLGCCSMSNTDLTIVQTNQTLYMNLSYPQYTPPCQAAMVAGETVQIVDNIVGGGFYDMSSTVAGFWIPQNQTLLLGLGGCVSVWTLGGSLLTVTTGFGLVLGSICMLIHF